MSAVYVLLGITAGVRDLAWQRKGHGLLWSNHSRLLPLLDIYRMEGHLKRKGISLASPSPPRAGQEDEVGISLARQDDDTLRPRSNGTLTAKCRHLR